MFHFCLTRTNEFQGDIDINTCAQTLEAALWQSQKGLTVLSTVELLGIRLAMEIPLDQITYLGGGFKPTDPVTALMVSGTREKIEKQLRQAWSSFKVDQARITMNFVAFESVGQRMTTPRYADSTAASGSASSSASSGRTASGENNSNAGTPLITKFVWSPSVDDLVAIAHMPDNFLSTIVVRAFCADGYIRVATWILNTPADQPSSLRRVSAEAVQKAQCYDPYTGQKLKKERNVIYT